MNHLWAPWRLEYLTGPGAGGCVFCDCGGGADDRASRIVGRSAVGFLILNRFPYNSGHLMAVPTRHVTRLDALRSEEAQGLWHLVEVAVRALERVMAPQGFNIGINVGLAAGAGFEHLHVHIVPRWAGDTNYMPVLGETKVLPEHLDQTYERLAAAVAEVSDLAGGPR
jgi:ATP adenylyltransferase